MANRLSTERRGQIIGGLTEGMSIEATVRVTGALGLSGKPYTMRRIQQAVCVVRRHRLVSAKTLVAAGYNATES